MQLHAELQRCAPASAVAHTAELTLPAAEKAPAWLYTLHRINMGDLEYIHKAGEPQSPFRDDILAGRVVLIVSTDQAGAPAAASQPLPWRRSSRVLPPAAAAAMLPRSNGAQLSVTLPRCRHLAVEADC